VEDGGPRADQPIDGHIALLDPSWICDRALFLNRDFTNVNFFGLTATTAGLLVLCLLGTRDKVVEAFTKGWSLCQRFWTWMSPHLRLLRDNSLSALTQVAITIGDGCDKAHGQLSSILDSFRRLFQDCQRASLKDLCSLAWWIQRSRHLAQGHHRSPFGQSWTERVRRQSLPQPFVTLDVDLADVTIRPNNSQESGLV
jgi:hypothetical protein